MQGFRCAILKSTSSILAGDLDRCWRSIFVFACTKLSGALKTALSIGSSNVIKIRQFPRLSGVDETKAAHNRSEEHTSELQSLMRISYAVFCLKKKNIKDNIQNRQLHLYTSQTSVNEQHN